MGTTPKGFPYPEDIDPVAQGAQAIKALAMAVDTLIGKAASGSFTLAAGTSGSGGTWGGNTAVTFPNGRFTAAPSVTINRSTGIANASLPLVYYCSGITATGFIAYVIASASGGAAQMQYLAVSAP